MKINVALGISRNWFLQACVTAASILSVSNIDDDYTFYILSNGFSNTEKDMFLKLKNLRNVKFEFVTINDAYFNGAVHDWLGVSSSYRLFLPKATKENKVLYLDSDIVALQDISSLYSTNISNYYIAAIEDKCSAMMRNRIPQIKPGEIFFNGGVQLMNLKKMREDNIAKKFIDKQRSSTFYTDQDTVNDICYGKIYSLPLKYNIVPAYGYNGRETEAQEALANPVLLHYAAKPWNTSSMTQVFEHWFKYKELYDSL